MPNCLHPMPNFWEAFVVVKVWRRVWKIGVGSKAVYEIDPSSNQLILILTLSNTDSITEFSADYLEFHVPSDRSIWVCFNITLYI